MAPSAANKSKKSVALGSVGEINHYHTGTCDVIVLLDMHLGKQTTQ